MSRLRQPLSYSAVSSVLSTVSFAGGRVGAECIQDDLSKLPTAADCWPTAGQLLANCCRLLAPHTSWASWRQLPCHTAVWLPCHTDTTELTDGTAVRLAECPKGLARLAGAPISRRQASTFAGMSNPALLHEAAAASAACSARAPVRWRCRLTSMATISVLHRSRA